MERYITKRTFGLALIPALAGACGNPAGNDDGGWLRATIQEAAAEVQFEGTGYFTVGSGHDVSVQFTLVSRGIGLSIDQRLIIHRPGAGIPAVGAYVLGPLEEKDGALQGLTAYYSREVDGIKQSFTAVSGQMEITISKNDLVAGTFWFSGALYCSSPVVSSGDDDWLFCGDPNTIDPSAQQVEVSGSFEVIPVKPGGDVLD